MGDTYETQVEGIRILPGQWRPHYPWEHIAWISPPWPCQDYVWLDFPETFVTEQGFPYISHVNPAIPSEEVKFVTLPAVSWRRTENGLTYERTLPSGLWFAGSLTRKSETEVALALDIANRGSQTFTKASLRTCIFLRAAREFNQFSSANKFAHFRGEGWLSFEQVWSREYSLQCRGTDADGVVSPDLPVAVCVSSIAPRLVAMTWFEDTFQVGGNETRPCLHADPRLPDLVSGVEVNLRGEIIFFEGSPDDFLIREAHRFTGSQAAQRHAAGSTVLNTGPTSGLNSRERMLGTMALEEADHVPCCFMSFTALRNRCRNSFYELCRAELEMGLDSMLFIPSASRAERPDHPDLRGLPVRFHPDVETRQHRQKGEGGRDILSRQYRTPAGTLTTSVQLSEDWLHADHLPFLDDLSVPRALEYLVKGPEDLGALKFLLIPPSEEDVAAFRREASQARAFADSCGILLAGGWGVGKDMADWLCGMENFMLMAMEQPGFARDLLRMIHEWNLARMKAVLTQDPIDLYVRRAWYEGCEFVTPAFFESVMLPILKRESEEAHAHGARFAYICTSGTSPVLHLYPEAGIDVLIGLDPVQGTQTDLAFIKERIGDRICLWGGVSGAVTVERGSEPEVRTAVAEALHVLGPTGFILSPIDNVTVDAPQTWENVAAFIDEWKRRRER